MADPSFDTATEFFIGQKVTSGRPLGLSRLGQAIPRHTEGYEITDLDPEGVGVGVFPRAIEVQTNDADGAKLSALWHGDFSLSVGDFVRCRKDPSSPILIIEGYGQGTAPAAGAGYPFDILTVDLTDSDAGYSTLADANTAAGANDEVLFGPGVFTFTNLTLKGAAYRGQGKDVTTLASSYASGTALTIPDDCIIENLTISHSYTSASSRTTIGYAGTGTAYIRNCRILSTNASSGGTIAIANTGGGTVILENVEVVSDGGSGITYGLYIFTSSTVTAHNCIFTATTTGGYVTGGLPYHRPVALLDSGSVANLYDSQITPERIWRNGDFSPANITWGWAASPPAQYNPIVNGSFNLWQRGISFAAAASYTADRWRFLNFTDGVFTVSRSSDVPTVAQASRLINYSLLVDCTTADATIGATQSDSVGYIVEGYDWLDYAQQGFWLSFWVKATKTGTFCISFRNSGLDRSFIAEYTINTTATWEYKEIYVDASPAAGTWDYTNGIGLFIRWALAAGSSLQTTAWSWQTGSYAATANQVNATDSVANDFRLWGIMMSKTRSPFWQPDYQQELARAQRYYFDFFSTGGGSTVCAGYTGSTTVARMIMPTPVQMRDAPTVTIPSGVVVSNGSSISITSIDNVAVRPDGVRFNANVASGLTANHPAIVRFSGGSVASFDAEL